MAPKTSCYTAHVFSYLLADTMPLHVLLFPLPILKSNSLVKRLLCSTLCSLKLCHYALDLHNFVLEDFGCLLSQDIIIHLCQHNPKNDLKNNYAYTARPQASNNPKQLPHSTPRAGHKLKTCARNRISLKSCSSQQT